MIIRRKTKRGWAQRAQDPVHSVVVSQDAQSLLISTSDKQGKAWQVFLQGEDLGKVLLAVQESAVIRREGHDA